MNTLLSLLGLAGIVGVAWYGHKQINRLDNLFSSMDAGIRALPGSRDYVKARFPGSFQAG